MYPPPPPVLSQTPTTVELAEMVNRTDAITQLSTNSAKVDVLTMPSLPKLSATINLQRDRNFRLRANLPVMLGAGMDVGSNDELFWFEVPDQGMSRVIYYARHDEYRQQLSRAILPVDPTWLMDAIGLVHLDPASVVSGPQLRPDGKLEVRSNLPMPNGNYQRVCYVAHPGGYVTEQFLFAPDGRLVATSEASDHRFYEQQQCVLPHRIKFDLVPAAGPPLSMEVEISSYAVNQLLSGDANLFTMPQTASRSQDLTRLPTAPAVTELESHYRVNRTAALPLRGTDY